MQCSEDCDHIRTIESRIRKIAKNTEKVILIYPVPTHPYNISESYFNRQNFWGEFVSTDIGIGKRFHQIATIFKFNKGK